jgi:hypothetical protein
MDQVQNIYGLIIGFVAVAGGLGIGLYAVHISVTTENKRKMAAEAARHAERLALIERGMDPLLADKRIPKDYRQGSLLWGMLLAGIGVGALIGNILAPLWPVKPDLTVNASALLFGGLGLLGYYAIGNRRGTDVNQVS